MYDKSVPVMNFMFPARLRLTGDEVDYDVIEGYLTSAIQKIKPLGTRRYTTINEVDGYKKIIDTLKSICYDGDISIEANLQDSQNICECIKNAINTLKPLTLI